jgi:hypothetical protein
MELCPKIRQEQHGTGILLLLMPDRGNVLFFFNVCTVLLHRTLRFAAAGSLNNLKSNSNNIEEDFYTLSYSTMENHG